MKYVVYYRVSSKQQGQSGLGLEAQRTAVEAYLKTHKAEEIPPAFEEVESGRNNHRPFSAITLQNNFCNFVTVHQL